MCVPDFNALRKKWIDRADIVVVYLREAHASDEWPLGNHVCVQQAKCTEDRARAARDFVAATGLELQVFLDGEGDPFMTLLSAHPQRYFVIDSAGVLHLKATPFEGEYDLSDVDRTLERLCGQ